MYKIENLGFELVSDGDLEQLLDNTDDANKNKLIKYVVTHLEPLRSFMVRPCSMTVVMQLSLHYS